MYLLGLLPGISFPFLKAGMGLSQGKCSAKDQIPNPGGGRAPMIPAMDNSLLREHHGLILDLSVQGQDVLINEWALWEGETDRLQALIRTVGGLGWEAVYAPPPTQQMAKAPSNLFRAHSKGPANVAEQMSH